MKINTLVNVLHLNGNFHNVNELAIHNTNYLSFTFLKAAKARSRYSQCIWKECFLRYVLFNNGINSFFTSKFYRQYSIMTKCKSIC